MHLRIGFVDCFAPSLGPRLGTTGDRGGCAGACRPSAPDIEKVQGNRCLERGKPRIAAGGIDDPRGLKILGSANGKGTKLAVSGCIEDAAILHFREPFTVEEVMIEPEGSRPPVSELIPEEGMIPVAGKDPSEGGAGRE